VYNPQTTVGSPIATVEELLDILMKGYENPAFYVVNV